MKIISSLCIRILKLENVDFLLIRVKTPYLPNEIYKNQRKVE